MIKSILSSGIFACLALLAAANSPSPDQNPITISFWQDQQCYLGKMDSWELSSSALDSTLGYSVREAGSFAMTSCKAPCVVVNRATDNSNQNYCATRWLCNCAVNGNGATTVTIGATTNMENPYEWCASTGQTIQEPSDWYCEVSADTSDLGQGLYQLYDNQYFDVYQNDNYKFLLGGTCKSGARYVCHGGYATFSGNVMECDSNGNIISGEC